MRRLMVTAALAIAMAATPTIATAQRASTPAASAAQVQPASEVVDGSELKGRGDFIIPLAVLVGIILALLLTQKDDKQDFPTSP